MMPVRHSLGRSRRSASCPALTEPQKYPSLPLSLLLLQPPLQDCHHSHHLSIAPWHHHEALFPLHWLPSAFQCFHFLPDPFHSHCFQNQHPPWHHHEALF